MENVKITGSISVTCEYKGEIYVAVCRRSREVMTQAGTTMRTTSQYGPPDATRYSTALRSLNELFGLTPEKFPVLLEKPLVSIERDTGPQAAEVITDTSKQQRGSFPPGVRQIADDYGAHLGAVDELPKLAGKEPFPQTPTEDTDTKPTWLRVRDIEKIVEGDRTFYRLSKDNGFFLKDSEVMPKGGMHMIEPTIAAAREIPFRKAGYNGVEGFMLMNSLNLAGVEVPRRQRGEPETQVGEKTALLYEKLNLALKARSFTRTRESRPR